MPLCGYSADKTTQLIDKRLREDKRKLFNEVKILLLGSGESGKSTIFKQMKILQNGSLSKEELMSFQHVIYGNTITQMKLLCAEAIKVGINMSTEENQRKAERMIQCPGNGDSWRSDLATDMRMLWRDPGIQQVFGMGPNKRNVQLNDSTEYFFNSLERMSSPTYIPSEEDILRCRVRSTGIEEANFCFEDFHFKMMDVGGQRSERKKWLHCFERVTAVIFCVSLSEYDEVLREEILTNRMDESLQLFGEVFNSSFLKKVTFILFFNKNDLFEEKIKKQDLNVCFRNYVGGCDKDQARNFIIARFLEKNLSERFVYTHTTVAIDTKNMRTIFQDVKEIILKKVLDVNMY